MKKAVLISIRPQWCAKIASGEKTIEFRKSRPELKKPFKCYIYCTKADYYTWDLRVSNVTIPFAEKCCGKVIASLIVPTVGRRWTEVLTMSKWCFGLCARCAWRYNGGCSEWRCVYG